MKKKYKVIWFDDEHETLEAIKEEALNNDINLIGFSNSEEGLDELKKNIEFYDAVIVDGLFYKTKLQSGDAVSDNALFTVARTLDKLEIIKKIPWFILSGQASFTRERNRIAEEYKDNKVYDKNNDPEIEQLWNDLKTQADKQIDTQLRHKHQAAFEVCTEKYVGKHVAKDLLFLLNEDNHKNSDQLFNSVRKIVEDIFNAFNKYDLLPDEFVLPTVSLNESSKFLSGHAEKGYNLNKESELPKSISYNLRSVLSLTQAGSHRTNNDELFEDIGSSYFFQATLNQLLSIVVWFKNHIDSNPKQNNWSKIEIKDIEEHSEIPEGIIEQDEYGNYYCGEFALYERFTKDNYRIGDKIKIIESAKNTNIQNKRLYPYFATRFEKAN